MCTLAHVLEAAGLATVALPSNLKMAERIRPPRALYCPFPLGRPLGKPRDPVFQRRVLDTAFALLERPAGPVLEVFPETIEEESMVPVACPVPARLDVSVPAAVDEARALRPAWERAYAANGRTQVGQVDEIPDAAARFVRLAEVATWDEAGFASHAEVEEMALDLRAYYEEVALALSGHVPAARAAETWFYRSTATGRMILRAVDVHPGLQSILPLPYRKGWKPPTPGAEDIE